MSYYSKTQDCGCYVEVEVDAGWCTGHEPGDYCYCYDYSNGLTDVTIKYCTMHGGS